MAALSFIGFLFPLLFIALIVLIIGALVAGRGEPDTTGRRPYSIYLSVVTFVALLTSIGAAFAFIKALADTLFVGGGIDACPPGLEFCGDFSSGGGGGGRAVVEAVVILVVAGAFTYLHGKKLLELRGLEPGSSSPAARVLLVFAYAVCFMSVFAVLAAAVGALIALLDIVDPQEGFGGGRDQALSTLVSSLAIGALTGLIFRYAWQTFDLGLKQTAHTPPAAPTQTV